MEKTGNGPSSDIPYPPKQEAIPSRSGRDTPERPIKCNDIYTFGGGGYGQLGHGAEKNEKYPRLVRGVTYADFETPLRESNKISCGAFYTAAVSDVGEVYTWGEAKYGKLGHGDEKHVRIPQIVEGLRDVGIRRVVCGMHHTVALSSTGLIYTWGWGSDYKLGHGDEHNQPVPRLVEALKPIKVVRIAAGGSHTAALATTGELYTWGDGQAGQLGHGDRCRQRHPKVVDALRGKNMTQIACGEHHTACLTADGSLHTWGFGANGRLGHGDDSTQTIPKQVEALRDKRVIYVALGGFHSAAITDERDVYAWGQNDHGQLGMSQPKVTFIPKAVDSLAAVRACQVACGSRHTAVLDTAGLVYTFGWAEDGQLGHGAERDVDKPRIVTALMPKGVVQVVCGWNHTAALTAPPWTTHHQRILQRSPEPGPRTALPAPPSGRSISAQKPKSRNGKRSARSGGRGLSGAALIKQGAMTEPEDDPDNHGDHSPDHAAGVNNNATARSHKHRAAQQRPSSDDIALRGNRLHSRPSNNNNIPQDDDVDDGGMQAPHQAAPASSVLPHPYGATSSSFLPAIGPRAPPREPADTCAYELRTEMLPALSNRPAREACVAPRTDLRKYSSWVAAPPRKYILRRASGQHQRSRTSHPVQHFPIPSPIFPSPSGPAANAGPMAAQVAAQQDYAGLYPWQGDAATRYPGARELYQVHPHGMHDVEPLDFVHMYAQRQADGDAAAVDGGWRDKKGSGEGGGEGEYNRLCEALGIPEAVHNVRTSAVHQVLTTMPLELGSQLVASSHADLSNKLDEARTMLSTDHAEWQQFLDRLRRLDQGLQEAQLAGIAS